MNSKLMIIVLMLFLMALSVSASERSVMVKRITLIEEPFSDTIHGSITIMNSEDRSLDDVRIRIAIPDLAVWKDLREFDIDANSFDSTWINMDIPKADPGFYLMRVSISDAKGDLRAIRYRWVEIA